jgi:pimeloyl-ACP methyl ester carboxylesterase
MDNDGIISKEADVNGIRINYRIAGSGGPLVLLHGLL